MSSLSNGASENRDTDRMAGSARRAKPGLGFHETSLQAARHGLKGMLDLKIVMGILSHVMKLVRSI